MKQDDLDGVYREFVNVLSSGGINPVSTPGWPLSVYGSDVDSVINILGVEKVCLIATARYALMDAIPLEVMDPLPAMERVVLGIVGVKRLFVKNEPHTINKLAEGRERVIWNLDFIDQLIERALLHRQYSAEKAVYYEIPSVNGMGNTDEGIEVIRGRIGCIDDPITSDMSGYDNTTSAWIERVEALRLCYSMGIEHYDCPVSKMFDNLNTSVTIIPGGSIYAQKSKGGKKSGSYTTSQSGSAQRIMYSCFAFVDECEGGFAHGDDCAESSRGVSDHEFVERYKRVGLRVKDLQRGDGLEFCGLSRGPNPTFLKPFKALTNFFQEVDKDKDPTERIVTIMHELRHHPDKEQFALLIYDVLNRGEL